MGYDENEKPIEVPWSRAGTSMILDNGLIDSMEANWGIYEISEDGVGIKEMASCEPYDYENMAELSEAKWRFYINEEEVEHDFYVEYLEMHGYMVGELNATALIDWIGIN